jgi:transglutaminase-like putative cysteine protease
MQIAIDHTTVYRYSEKVSRSTQYIRLTPPAGQGQKVMRWEVELPARAVSLCDAFDNLTHVLTLDSAYDEIRLRAHGVVEVGAEPAAQSRGAVLEVPPLIHPTVFLRPTPLTEPDQALREFALGLRANFERSTEHGLLDLMDAVLKHMPYRPGSTSVSHTAAESFGLSAGVCQDHTHVFLSCARLLGVPSRYVSGYINPAGQTQAASHAWAEAWVGGRWLSFDVSNGQPAGSGHVRLAIGRDYLDACPVRGVRSGGGEESLSVAVTVKVLTS